MNDYNTVRVCSFREGVPRMEREVVYGLVI